MSRFILSSDSCVGSGHRTQGRTQPGLLPTAAGDPPIPDLSLAAASHRRPEVSRSRSQPLPRLRSPCKRTARLNGLAANRPAGAAPGPAPASYPARIHGHACWLGVILLSWRRSRNEPADFPPATPQPAHLPDSGCVGDAALLLCRMADHTRRAGSTHADGHGYADPASHGDDDHRDRHGDQHGHADLDHHPDRICPTDGDGQLHSASECNPHPDPAAQPNLHRHRSPQRHACAHSHRHRYLDSVTWRPTLQ